MSDAQWWCIGCGAERQAPGPCGACNGKYLSRDTTKRELFAMAALQGLLAGSDWEGEPAKFAPDAVECADALLIALEAKP